MVKFRSAGDNAAYEIAVGVTDAEEAAKLKLAVVETDPTSGAPTAYGRYKDAPDGGPLGVTVPKNADTEVIGSGQVSAAETGPHGGKGHLINPDDPVIHGGGDDIHRDGSEPPVEDLAAEEREAREVADESNEKVRAKAEKSRK